MRGFGLEHLKGRTTLTRFSSASEELIARFIARVAKELRKPAVGKFNGEIRALQVHKGGKAVQHAIEFFPFRLQGQLGLLAFGGVAYGAQEQMGVGFILIKKILGPLADRGEGQGFISLAGQDHEGHVGGLIVGLDEGIQAPAVRETQIQQDQVDLVLVQPLQPISQPGHPLDGKILDLGFGQHLPDQAGVSRIVLHQQDSGWLGAHHAPHLGGSITTVSQKSSMDFTTSIKRSRSTGLVI